MGTNFSELATQFIDLVGINFSGFIISIYAPINVKPHLPHPRDMWGLGGDKTLLVVACPAPRAELQVRSWLPEYYVMQAIRVAY